LKENSEFCLTRAQNMEFGTQAAWTRQERKMQNEKDDTLVPFLSLSLQRVGDDSSGQRTA